MTIDDSYIEAAHVDGMGKFGTIFRIMVPMCKPTVITVALTAFMGGWNNYFWPKVIIKEQNMYLLTVGIQKLRTSYGGEITNNYHQIMAGRAAFGQSGIHRVCIVPEAYAQRIYKGGNEINDSSQIICNGSRRNASGG